MRSSVVCYAVPVKDESAQVNAGKSGPEDSAGAVLRRLGPAAVLGALWAVTPLIGLLVMGYYAPTIAGFLQDRPGVGYWLYIVGFAVAAGAGLLPTWSQAVLGGYVFGLWRGFVAAEAGFVLAALLAFVLARTVARERVEREILAHPKAAVVRDALVGRGFWGTLGVVTLLRLNSPFALTNLALTATGVPIVTYVIGTAVGLGVRTFVAVHAGSQLTSWGQAEKPKWLIISGLVVAVVVVVMIGQIAQRALQKLSSGTEHGGASA